MLWAAYPESGTNLTNSALLVTTIHGSDDGLVSDTQITDSLKQLPPSTVRVEIAGGNHAQFGWYGNHAQFGWYGNQQGDNEPKISRELQQSQIVNATLQLLQKLR